MSRMIRPAVSTWAPAPEPWAFAPVGSDGGVTAVTVVFDDTGSMSAASICAVLDTEQACLPVTVTTRVTVPEPVNGATVPMFQVAVSGEPPCVQPVQETNVVPSG